MICNFVIMFAVSVVGTSAVYSANDIKVFRALDSRFPPANIGVSADGRIFMSTHLAYGSEYKVVELTENGGFARYPDTDFTPALNGILGTVVDEQGILWFLDTIWGKDAMGRVIGWDINKNQLYRIYYIARPLVNDAYILNDMAVDRDNEAMYISETASATTSALLVLDLQTGLVRRVLDGSFATVPEDKDLIIDDQLVKMQGQAARVGVNPITIDVNNEWVYFAPMSGHKMYRVKTRDLLDQTLSEQALVARIETYADKPMSDGITIDADNNIYISDLVNNAIGVIKPDRTYEILFQDDTKLSWVEGFANAGELGILATSNKLFRSPAFNNDKPIPNDFYIMNFQPIGKAVIGR